MPSWRICTSPGPARGHGARGKPAPDRPRGFLAFDAVMAVGLTLLLALVMAAACRGFADARHEMEARRALRLAADAELLRLRAAGLEGYRTETTDPGSYGPNPVPASRVEGGITLEVHVQPAETPWDGMVLVTVVARKQVYGRWTSVELSAYLPAPGEAQP
jgi:hypothetical protein